MIQSQEWCDGYDIYAMEEQLDTDACFRMKPLPLCLGGASTAIAVAVPAHF